MRLVLYRVRHLGIQFSLIALITMVFFFLVRLVTESG